MNPMNIGIKLTIAASALVGGYLTKFIYDNRDDLRVKPIDECLNPKEGENGFTINGEDIKQFHDDVQTLSDLLNRK